MPNRMRLNGGIRNALATLVANQLMIKCVLQRKRGKRCIVKRYLRPTVFFRNHK